ncbi:uncharacterized protein LOC132141145 isoform X2 [Carassius carassius]|uniref:uncharacterized protein LOC132141145 isoform X2 n=1 Tax=Carassius carassius TaxID=217509 RepID=UPI00286861B9|nr:uncharacterized protein LOC132141145 isoform X2 [Carassius carassius]
MMKHTRTRKICVKNEGINTNKEELRSVRDTVIRWNGRGQTIVGSGNSQVYDLTDDLSKKENILEVLYPLSQTQSIMNNQPVNTFGIQEDGNKLNPTNTYTQCPTSQLLCDSCLYPCTSAACTNKLCPLVSTLLTCDLVSDPQSRVFGCPTFRACPKCHNLIMHEKGCKFVICKTCTHQFCFICLEGDCSKDKANYWKLTCTKPRAKRQRFMAPQS